MRSIGLLVLMAASLAATPAVAQVKFTGRTLLKSSTAMDGSPVAYPKTDSAEVTAMLMEIAPGGETGWHMHTAPTFGSFPPASGAGPSWCTRRPGTSEPVRRRRFECSSR